MRVASLQMTSGPDRMQNLRVASQLLQQAADQGAELAVLPENFSLMSVSDQEKRALAESEQHSSVLDFLSQQASAHQMAIIGGSILLRGDQGLLRNSSPAFDADGKLLDIYDKIHLFDVEIDGESYHESSTIQPGHAPVVVQHGAFRIGLSICYDLRFPELYRHYADAGCHMVSVVAAFTAQTGKAHWQTLLTARAIENQCYVIASAQAGTHADGRKTWGHAMIIDPWGEVMAMQEAGEGVVMADLSLARLESVRRMLPALQHRRNIPPILP
ncbi:carbon-nitrogen hydrolase family protein [Mariprofundus erugo]|uniref:Carbon-nitrogen hydrolase family protein n=1 Tax=Mariprofundus erugo TaxID=2528639 RepID=A0A5R9GTW5_9PROT|nr:carbon-nitrogen hydrolase family protein [Mariprofundus erugo]TLS67873.1 carbon-nitrogen hydrolase family protein [Mariprofundus erugo]TLS73615.1 carbon-nitrogen hydrolase family protein [Mariprofundus erugo]